jgi:hypothetical protein
MSKIDWNKAENCLPGFVAAKYIPFHASVLAEMSGLSVAQVHYRLRKCGLSLKEIRNGRQGIGAEIKQRYTVTNLKVKDSQRARFYCKRPPEETHSNRQSEPAAGKN